MTGGREQEAMVDWDALEAAAPTPLARERIRLCNKLRVFTLRRFIDEVTRPHHRALVTGEDFDPDAAFRERPSRDRG